MSDVVVTVPKHRWAEWIMEGQLPGDPWEPGDTTFDFFMGGRSLPRIKPGERVYIVSHGRLRGYAPLIYLATDADDLEWARGRFGRPTFSLNRGGGAVAVTIPEVISGFRGFRYRWWERSAEVPFPEWRQA